MNLPANQWYTVKEAAAAFPAGSNGKRVSVRSLWRWMSSGKRGVRLRFAVVANRRLISAEAIYEFLRETNIAAGGTEDSGNLVMAARARLARQRLANRYGYKL